MQAIGFYVVLPFIYLISLLPFPFLYLLSDLLFVILYHIIGYRRKVVIQNLKNTFPEMPEKEIIDLQKRFYIYLCDLTLETFKTLTISEKKMVKHCSMDEGSLQLIKQYYDDKKSITIETPGGNKMIITEEDKKVHLEDQNGNILTMNEDGINIESIKDIKIKASGDVKIEGTNLNIKGSSQVKVDGGSGTEISSGGTTNVKGSMVNIN